jgi:hypothetical protein
MHGNVMMKSLTIHNYIYTSEVKNVVIPYKIKKLLQHLKRNSLLPVVIAY